MVDLESREDQLSKSTVPNSPIGSIETEEKSGTIPHVISAKDYESCLDSNERIAVVADQVDDISSKVSTSSSPEENATWEATTRRSEDPTKSFYQNIYISLNNVRAILGNINHSYYGSSAFGSIKALPFAYDDGDNMNYRKGRTTAAVSLGRASARKDYEPYVSITEPRLKIQLIEIAAICQQLDTLFAEYFRAAICPLKGVDSRLQTIREQICSGQSSTTAYIGRFGSYCERLTSRSVGSENSVDVISLSHLTGDANIGYLQDALEIPYWELVIDRLISSRHVNNETMNDVLFSTITDKRRLLKSTLKLVKAKWRDELPQSVENGIVRRIDILDCLLAQSLRKQFMTDEESVGVTESSIMHASISEPIHNRPESKDIQHVRSGGSSHAAITDLEKVSLVSLLFCFTTLALVPYSMALHDYLAVSAVGSWSDPDFKALIATTLLTTLGNIYVIVPLRKVTRGSSLAYLGSEGLSYLSIAFGLAAVCAYPFYNKAWSVTLSFLCTFFALGSAFISARYASNTLTIGTPGTSKMKSE